jgi:hypothetical protein
MAETMSEPTEAEWLEGNYLGAQEEAEWRAIYDAIDKNRWQTTENLTYIILDAVKDFRHG